MGRNRQYSVNGSPTHDTQWRDGLLALAARLLLVGLAGCQPSSPTASSSCPTGKPVDCGDWCCGSGYGCDPSGPVGYRCKDLTCKANGDSTCQIGNPGDCCEGLICPDPTGTINRQACCIPSHNAQAPTSAGWAKCTSDLDCCHDWNVTVDTGALCHDGLCY